MSNTDTFAIQMRVRVNRDNSEDAHGVIVEDYGEQAGYPVEVGADHIADAARRWAVLLDSGSLIFADDRHLSRE